MAKITKHRKLQNGEIQDVKSYRMAKDKTSKTTERRKTKCRILQNVKIQNVENTKRRKTLNAKKIGRIGYSSLNIGFFYLL